MPKEDWEKAEDEYSLEEILAEFSSYRNPGQKPAEAGDEDDLYSEEETDRQLYTGIKQGSEGKKKAGRRLQRSEGREIGEEEPEDEGFDGKQEEKTAEQEGSETENLTEKRFNFSRINSFLVNHRKEKDQPESLEEEKIHSKPEAEETVCVEEKSSESEVVETDRLEEVPSEPEAEETHRLEENSFKPEIEENACLEETFSEEEKKLTSGEETEGTVSPLASAVRSATQKIGALTSRMFKPERKTEDEAEEGEITGVQAEGTERGSTLNSNVERIDEQGNRAVEEKARSESAVEGQEKTSSAERTLLTTAETDEVKPNADTAGTEEQRTSVAEEENRAFVEENGEITSSSINEEKWEDQETLTGEEEWASITEEENQSSPGINKDDTKDEQKSMGLSAWLVSKFPSLRKYARIPFDGYYNKEPPDTSPEKLADRYGRGLYSLAIRRWLVLVLAIELLVLSIIQTGTTGRADLQMWNIVFPLLCAVVQLVALFLSYDLMLDGLLHLGLNTIITVAVLMAFLDAITMGFLNTRNDGLPYCLITTLALFVRLWGMYMEQDCRRSASRMAASTSEPYRVTLDADRWDNQDAYVKWSGRTDGFGRQIQTSDITSRVFHRLTLPLLIACLVFSLVSAVISQQADLIIWNLSATTSACAGMAAAFSFALPFRLSTGRMSSACVALAGWEGISCRPKRSCIVLGDYDLFPPGSVVLNGVKIFPEYSRDLVISYTATLIQHSESGLDRIFWEYMQSQGNVYRSAEDVTFHEGGISAVIGIDRVLVGDEAFMNVMGVSLPQGLNVKSAVFCAINLRVAGIFALNYSLHTTVRPSLSALISNRVTPVLATRDFNVTPAMLTKRFRLSGDQLVLPLLRDRWELSDPELQHDDSLIGILCREGIGPFVEAVVGGRRLFSAVRLNTIFAVAEVIIGLLLAFFLTANVAFSSLSMFNLLFFHVAWLIPILLISGWVNRY